MSDILISKGGDDLHRRYGRMSMRRSPKWILAVVVGLVALAMAQATALAAGYSDTVSGREIYATSTEGRFAGQAAGALPGYWYADVVHTPLTGSPETAAITGGIFDLSTTISGQPVLVTGLFSGGSVVQTGGFGGCTNQTYSVSGDLTNVGPYGGSQTGTGTFAAVLTHYRYSSYGYCITYAASIAGTVNLAF
jgi:hypothetical protein